MSNMNIPGNYAVCIASDSCPLAGQCLRVLAYKQLAQSPKQSVSISIVNPNNDEIRYAPNSASSSVRLSLNVTPKE